MVSQTTPAKSTGTLSSEISISISNTASYTSTFSTSITNRYITGSISATVGYSVTKSYSQKVSRSITLKKGQRGLIEVRPVYKTLKGTLQRKYITDFGKEIWMDNKTVYTRKFSHFDFNDKIW